MDAISGREIAGYRIESEIGRGGMGVVYLATQAFPERKVALKLLSPELAADPAFRERFVRESNAAASTEHPNIVPVYGAGEADGQLYLAMRYVEGTDLRSLLEREGPLAPERAARICAQVAEALEAAHERGLVHRDVKPGNVLLDGRERAYLSDFGLIRRTRVDTEITRTGQFMGTVDYVAPEQIKGGELDGRADVYSLGCVLYECLTGAAPFRRDSELATMYAQLEDPVPAPSSVNPAVPKSLDQVVAQATAKRPDDRFATAGEMAEAVRGAPVRESERPHGRRLFVAIGVAAMLAIGLAIALIATNDGTGEDAPSTTVTGSTGAEALPLPSLVEVDAETGEILTSPPFPLVSNSLFGGLRKVEVGEGGVWVLGRDGRLTHADPEAPQESTDISISPGLLGTDSLAVGYRTVWVGTPPGVVRIDPIDDEELRPVRLYPPGVFNGAQLALGASDVWAVTGDGELTRIDPATGTKTMTVDLGQTASGLDVGFGAVWIIDELQETLTRFDLEKLEADEPIPIPGNPQRIAAGAGAVWILDSVAGIVTPFDPTSERVGSPIRVGTQPADLAVGLDAVWVANLGDGTISRIDPLTSTVETIQIGAPVSSIAVDEQRRSLWIVVAELASEA